MKLQGTATRKVSNLVRNTTARFPHTFENMRRQGCSCSSVLTQAHTWGSPLMGWPGAGAQRGEILFQEVLCIKTRGFQVPESDSQE